MKGRKNNSNQNISNKTDKDYELDYALKALGYLVPETEDEVHAFEEINGNTEVELPEHLKKSNFLFKNEINSEKEEFDARQEIKNFQKEEKKGQTKSKNDYFKKLILAAKIADELCEEPTFGHVKFVKTFCICNEVCNMKLSTNYEKYAAGPLDSKLMYTIDGEFKKRKWFKVEKIKMATRYTRIEKIEDYKKYYLNYFKDQSENIDTILNLFRKLKTDFCEKVATLFFVWKEALNNKTIITNTLLIQEFYSWHEQKKRFTEKELIEAITWMKNNRIIPIAN